MADPVASSRPNFPVAAVTAACLAIVVGIGLSRFAYSPLMPAMIAEGWFSSGEAAFLGGANFTGYLLGALAASSLVSSIGAPWLMRLSMLIASAAFLASAFPVSFSWFFGWRLVSGIAGGLLMVAAASSVLPRIASSQRGIASGVIFSGVGIGIIASGSLLPGMVRTGLTFSWICLGLVSLAATIVTWRLWPDHAGIPSATRRVSPSGGRGVLRTNLIAIYASYGLIAVGLVPHMVFLVDFIARGLGHGVSVGGWYWTLFGTGALLGPVIAGRLADAVGYATALRMILVLHVLGVGVLFVSHALLPLIASSLIVGSAVSGAVPLVMGQVREQLDATELQIKAWGIATASFAVGQAVAGYAYSLLFIATGEYFPILFLIGASALALALLTNVLANPPPCPPTTGSVNLQPSQRRTHR